MNEILTTYYDLAVVCVNFNCAIVQEDVFILEMAFILLVNGEFARRFFFEETSIGDVSFIPTTENHYLFKVQLENTHGWSCSWKLNIQGFPLNSGFKIQSLDRLSW